MRQSVQKIVNKGNLSSELAKLIEKYEAFEKAFFNGEGGAIHGIRIMDKFENKIINLARRTT